MSKGFIGGIRLAAATSIAVLMSGSAGFAADLGGNCCADLEERVAELEATTARKGNRKVSLTVSGHVNEAMMFYDDGNDEGFAVVTNNSSRSRFRFTGSAKINADWSAGFMMEIGVRGTNNSQSNTFTAFNNNVKSGLDVRHEMLYLDSKRFGRITLGHTGSAAEGITEICVGCGINQGFDAAHIGGGFRPGVGNVAGIAASASWSLLATSAGGLFGAGEGDRRDIVMYTSPSLMGFTLSAAAGSDEFYDVAVRYAGEFSGFRFAAGVGYQKSEEQGTSRTKGFAAGCNVVGGQVDCEGLGISAGIQHVATGLYVHGAYGYTEDNQALAANLDRDEGYYISGGINRKFFALGNTNIYAEYGNASRQIGTTAAAFIDATGAAFGGEVGMEWYGIGAVQTIDAAAMDLYIYYRHFEGDERASHVEDLDFVVVGSIIRF